jgi:hypothetical protein
MSKYCNGQLGDKIRIQGTRSRARAGTWLGRLGKARRGQGGAWLGWTEGERLDIRDKERCSYIG